MGAPIYQNCPFPRGIWTSHVTHDALGPCERNFARCKIHLVSNTCVLLYWQCYSTTLEQWASAKLWGVVQRMELRTFTYGNTYTTRRPSRLASPTLLVVLDCANQ